ncbi:MAG: hypothetical protein ACREB9_00720 [Thermoplasmata archaeon]
MPSRKSRAASSPGVPTLPSDPAPSGTNAPGDPPPVPQPTLADVMAAVGQMNARLKDHEEAIVRVLGWIGKQTNPTGGAPTAAPAQPTTYTPGAGMPPVEITPYGAPVPAQAPAPANGAPNDISPGMLQLLQLAERTFGAPAKPTLEGRMLEAFAGYMDAQNRRMNAEAGFTEMIMGTVTKKIAGGVGASVSKLFE